ncbi:MAG: protein kinase [Defluviitaleaceae bacterium]|nr:protein kinase [Defluviitaleaceae bacterium]
MPDIEYYKKYEPLFGAWSFERQLGEGSFGRVFEISKEESGQTLKSALKVITIPRSPGEVDKGLSPDEVRALYWPAVEAFIGEIALMSKLKDHSNIVKYEEHQIMEHEDGLGWDVFLRMELLTPLSDYMLANDITDRDVIRLGIDICKALEFCGDNDIIHRDVKTENILVSQNSDYKLGDFGTALPQERLPSDTTVIGTRSFMAPEVAAGGTYGFSADMYSLGMVMYRLLNGNQPPFLSERTAGMPSPAAAEREEALIRRLSGEHLPPPRDCSGRLAAIIMKACAYNAGDRFGSHSQMREALESISTNEYDLDATLITPKYESPPLPLYKPPQYAAPLPGWEPPPASTPDKKLGSKIFGKMIHWMLYTCVLSLLPFIIFTTLSYYFPTDGEARVLINELLFFGIIISIITLRDMVSLKLWERDSNIFNLALFVCIFVIVMSSVFYGIITLKALAPELAIDITNNNLRNYAAAVSLLSFLGGTAIQIWEVV